MSGHRGGPHRLMLHPPPRHWALDVSAIGQCGSISRRDQPDRRIRSTFTSKRRTAARCRCRRRSPARRSEHQPTGQAVGGRGGEGRRSTWCGIFLAARRAGSKADGLTVSSPVSDTLASLAGAEDDQPPSRQSLSGESTRPRHQVVVEGRTVAFLGSTAAGSAPGFHGMAITCRARSQRCGRAEPRTGRSPSAPRRLT